MASGKVRIDRLLVEKGLVETREKARALLMAGKVTVDGEVVDKPGTRVPPDAEVRVLEGMPYVSRGGLKLETALKGFSVDVSGAVCLDVGASTGGFTDCLLKHGAKRVYAIDVGRGQLDWRLRNDERVVLKEGFNARYLTEEDLPEKVDIAVIDVSFISLTLILPAVVKVLKESGKVIALVKPQFELSRREVKRGVVKDPALRFKAVMKVLSFSKELRLHPEGVLLSHPPGPKGNREYFLLLTRKKEGREVTQEHVRSVVFGD